MSSCTCDTSDRKSLDHDEDCPRRIVVFGQRIDRLPPREPDPPYEPPKESLLGAIIILATGIERLKKLRQ